MGWEVNADSKVFQLREPGLVLETFGSSANLVFFFLSRKFLACFHTRLQVLWQHKNVCFFQDQKGNWFKLEISSLGRPHPEQVATGWEADFFLLWVSSELVGWSGTYSQSYIEQTTTVIDESGIFLKMAWIHQWQNSSNM